jgi:1,4-alpha-glucan branching enzyme
LKFNPLTISENMAKTTKAKTQSEEEKAVTKAPAKKSLKTTEEAPVVETSIVVDQTPAAPPVELKNVEAFTRFSDFDISLFKSGKHFRLFEKLGSHTTEYQGVAGTYFAVWAPSAKSVSVIGNFNYWNKDSHHLFVRWDESGIWEGFIPHIGKGEAYKYCIEAHDGRKLEKIDPYAHYFETPPKTASIVWDNWYEWTDSDWMATRR